ncbi:MAG: phosphopentomutase [Bryobacter sp.]|jgi:phosphopentomutase|nr:phosphopentomutase [Bryobacter sp. CoA8 C33]
MAYQRIFWVVLDSVGIGAMPDWADYGDPAGSDTLGNIARQRRLELPNLCGLGLGNLKAAEGLAPVEKPLGHYGRCGLKSPGKDTTTGHWEMVGVILDKPFPLFPNGFPAEFLARFEAETGRRTLGNRAASGTEIIAELGDEHVRSGSPIVYTSADSVFQIAAHEEVIGLFELYRICEIARKMLVGKMEVGRVIARPFVGQPGAYMRTGNRKDYAVAPPRMLLDGLDRAGVAVHSVGKIFDIFLGRGIRSYEKTKSNAEGVAKTIAAAGEMERGLVFTNLVDFDSLYGHRNDVEGYARALEEFDAGLKDLMGALREGDLLILTADHGCDPTTASTDHSREYVPLLTYAPGREGGRDLGTRASLADVGQTVGENFGVKSPAGESFLSELA